MIEIYKAMRTIVDEYEDVVIVSPLHLNPKVRSLAYKYLGDHERIELIEPLDVVDFHNFVSNAYLILTDSGGIQEEAPSLNKPVLVLRDVTERPEGVAAGTLKIIGTDFENVHNTTAELLDNEIIYHQMSQTQNPYGDGKASERIIQALRHEFLGNPNRPERFGK